MLGQIIPKMPIYTTKKDYRLRRSEQTSGEIKNILFVLSLKLTGGDSPPLFLKSITYSYPLIWRDKKSNNPKYHIFKAS
jgi:hypothetical protein